MPFGEEILAGVGARDTVNLKYTADGRDNVRQRFTGYQKDIETELDFAEARMYQNRHGRFTAPDPLLSSASLDNPQTFNRYVYVGNNPVNLTDPSGLNWCRNDNTGATSFTGVGVACEKGFTSVDGEARRVGSGTRTATNGVAGADDVVRFNPEGTLTILDPANRADVADYARATGTEIQATSDPIEASPATISDHITSAFMTVMENNGGNAYYAITGTQSYNEHTELGQNIGNVTSLVESAFLIGNGLATTGAGGLLTIVTAPACLTGVGCAIPAGTLTITAAGLAQIAGGSAVLGNTIYNMSSNQGAGSRSGSLSGSSSGSGKKNASDYPETKDRNKTFEGAEAQRKGLEKAIEKDKKIPREKRKLGYVKRPDRSKQRADQHLKRAKGKSSKDFLDDLDR